MRIVIALGGHALLRRGAPLDLALQKARVERAAVQIARILHREDAAQAGTGAAPCELVITHGDGPQVELLTRQTAACPALGPHPRELPAIDSEGPLGYLLEQELANRLPGRLVATVLTRTEVSPDDPAFNAPSRPIGPVYTSGEAARIGRETDWSLAGDDSGLGQGMRRVVPSPAPLRVLSLPAIRCLLAGGAVVVAAGGGGVPVVQRRVAPRSDCGTVHEGVEAVIDKDACASLLARELQADCLLIATDVPALYADWGLPTRRALGHTTPAELERMDFAAGTMGPKVQAACDFVRATGRRAVIGSLSDIEGLLGGTAGTQIHAQALEARAAA